MDMGRGCYSGYFLANHYGRAGMADVISVGDLVVVVKAAPCCGYNGGVGKISTYIGTDDLSIRCKNCGLISNSKSTNLSNGYSYEFYRLKKIPPLTELETTEIKEDIPA
jgi:hypothetical protein